MALQSLTRSINHYLIKVFYFVCQMAEINNSRILDNLYLSNEYGKLMKRSRESNLSRMFARMIC